MLICERIKCQTSHDGSYGSGRFCSKKCARGFTTDSSRQAINERISKAFQTKLFDPHDDQTFANAVKRVYTWRKLAKELQFTQAGNIQAHLRRRVASLSIDTSHFLKKREPYEILQNTPNCSKPKLRTTLLKTGRKYICEICKSLPVWQGKSLTLAVDHINGNKYDHRQENLRFLCPNCHSQTDTFCGRNVKLRKLQK
jgi:Zn finger protein HypA/HybF involved in hydrogenase expression